MAFFGLTALGPQNYFEYASRSSTHIYIFTDDDFGSAWRRVLGNRSECETDEEMNRVFKTLYRGPVPDTDKALIAQSFAHLQAPYPRHIFMSTLIELRDRKDSESHEIRDGPGPACDFRESASLQAAIRNNKSSDRTLQQKQNAPLCASQEVHI